MPNAEADHDAVHACLALATTPPRKETTSARPPQAHTPGTRVRARARTSPYSRETCSRRSICVSSAHGSSASTQSTPQSRGRGLGSAAVTAGVRNAAEGLPAGGPMPAADPSPRLAPPRPAQRPPPNLHPTSPRTTPCGLPKARLLHSSIAYFISTAPPLARSADAGRLTFSTASNICMA